MRYPGTVQFFPQAWRRQDQLHATQKPVELIEYLVRTYSNAGETVLDNCMGSGTAGVACLNTGRKFIGIEQDASYFKIASDRIDAAHGLVDPKKVKKARAPRNPANSDAIPTLLDLMACEAA